MLQGFETPRQPPLDRLSVAFVETLVAQVTILGLQAVSMSLTITSMLWATATAVRMASRRDTRR